MATHSVERRLRAIIDTDRVRRPPGRTITLAAVVASLIVVLPLAAAVPGEEHYTGAWELRLIAPPGSQSGGDTAVLTLRTPGSTTHHVVMSAFEGITPNEIRTRTGPIDFALKRDAGTFRLRGPFVEGRGSGDFEFTPSLAFAEQLERRSIGRPTAREQLELARNAVGLALVDELQRQGIAPPTVQQLLRASMNQVSAGYVREVAKLGYGFTSLEPLNRLMMFDLTPKRIREANQSAGRRLTVEELVSREMRTELARVR